MPELNCTGAPYIPAPQQCFSLSMSAATFIFSNVTMELSYISFNIYANFLQAAQDGYHGVDSPNNKNYL